MATTQSHPPLSIRAQAQRLLITAIVLVAVALQLYGLPRSLSWMRATHFALDRIYLGLFAGVTVVAGISAAVLALMLAWRAASRADSRALALFLALLSYFLDWSTIGYLEEGRSDVVRVFIDWSIPTSTLFAVAALVRFSALFPLPLTPADVGVGRVAGRASGAWAAFRAWLLRPAAAWGLAAGILTLDAIGFAVSGPLSRALGVRVSLSGVLIPLTVGLLIGALALVVANLRASYAASDAAGRRRLFWVLEGVFAATIILALASAVKLALMLAGRPAAFGSLYALTSFTGLALLVLCLAIAMFRAGALDPALAIRRTALYGLVGIVMVFLFTGAEQFIEEVLATHLGLGSKASGMLTGGTVALAFEPIKHRIAALVDRGLTRLGIRPDHLPTPHAGDERAGDERATVGPPTVPAREELLVPAE